MKIDKIGVHTSNKKHATDISILVDKPEFIEEVKLLREKWNIQTLYQPINIDAFLASDYVQEHLTEFNADINLALKKFNRGKNFKLVIEYAVVTGNVPEGIYRGCYFDVVTIGEKNNLNNPEKYEYVIVLSPRTELKEVEQAYKEFREHIKGKIDFQTQDLNIEIPTNKELIEQYHVGNIHTSADIDKFKTQRELEKTREWYWMRYGDTFNDPSVKPKTYEQVYFAWFERCSENNEHKNKIEEARCPYCSVQSWNNIEVALKNYRELLSFS